MKKFSGQHTAQKELWMLMKSIEEKNLEDVKLNLKALMDRADSGEMPEIKIDYDDIYVPGVVMKVEIETGWQSS